MMVFYSKCSSLYITAMIKLKMIRELVARMEEKRNTHADSFGVKDRKKKTTRKT
jgi:hypothetical protein